MNEILIDAGDARRLREGEAVEVTCEARTGPTLSGGTVTLTSRGGGELTVDVLAVQQWRDALKGGPWMCTFRAVLASEVSA